MNDSRKNLLTKIANMYEAGVTYIEMRKVPECNCHTISQAVEYYGLTPRGSKNNGEAADKSRFLPEELSPTWDHKTSTKLLRQAL